jgi:hypothetical protein
MPMLPAVCSSCGAMFASGYYLSGTSTHVEGNLVQCPICGGIGRVPDGLYNLRDGLIELLSGPSQTIADLKRFAALLEEARAKRIPPEEVAAKVARELPQYEGFVRRFLLPRSPGDFFAFLLLVIAAIDLFKPHGATREEIEAIVNESIERMESAHPRVEVATPPRERVHAAHNPAQQAKPKIGRNQPCHCGSGKKFKRCHGK